MIEGEAKTTVFETAFRAAPIGMALIGLDGRWLEANDALCALVGRAREELLAADAEGPLPGELGLDLEQGRTLLEGKSPSYQLHKHYIHPDGKSLSALLSVALVRSAEGTPSFFIVQAQELGAPGQAEAQVQTEEPTADALAREDKPEAQVQTEEHTHDALAKNDELEAQVQSEEHTEDALGEDDKPEAQVQSEEQTQDAAALVQASSHQESLLDELTGSYNRRAFFLLAEQDLRAAARYERPRLLCFLDLDGLQEINLALGRDQGDRALVDLAELLRAVFRTSDIIARIGDDEFVVLAEADSSAEPSLRQRIGDAFDEHNEGGARPYFLAASLGVACLDPRRPVSLEDLLLESQRQTEQHKSSAQLPPSATDGVGG